MYREFAPVERENASTAKTYKPLDDAPGPRLLRLSGQNVVAVPAVRRRIHRRSDGAAMSTTQNQSFAPETEGRSPPRSHGVAPQRPSALLGDPATLQMRFCTSPLFAFLHRRKPHQRLKVKTDREDVPAFAKTCSRTRCPPNHRLMRTKSRRFRSAANGAAVSSRSDLSTRPLPIGLMSKRSLNFSLSLFPGATGMQPQIRVVAPALELQTTSVNKFARNGRKSRQAIADRLTNYRDEQSGNHSE